MSWRLNCGTVLQNSFIFNDSVLGNITESEQSSLIDKGKLETSLYVSNSESFINNLPLKINTE